MPNFYSLTCKNSDSGQAHISSPEIVLKKRSLFDAISKMAFWSHKSLSPAEVSDEKLIEKVLVHGDDQLRHNPLDVFSIDDIKNVWEKKLVIQEPRLHNLNLHVLVNSETIGKFFEEEFSEI